MGDAAALIAEAKRPVVLIGAGVRADAKAVQQLAEKLQAPIFSTTSGKGMIPDDHALAMGCISRLGLVQEMFNKSDLLYGLDLARHAGSAAGYLAVVEGYTDVMMAHQCGVANVVATMGTALTSLDLFIRDSLAPSHLGAGRGFQPVQSR